MKTLLAMIVVAAFPFLFLWIWWALLEWMMGDE